MEVIIGLLVILLAVVVFKALLPVLGTVFVVLFIIILFRTWRGR